VVELASKHLFFHGSVVLLAGLLSGIPMGTAIINNRGEDTVRAWRVSHSGLAMVGIMMLAIAATIPHLRTGDLTRWVMVWSYVISGYAFTVALLLGAWKGHRGLSPRPPFLNRIVYGGNMIGALGVLMGTLIVIIGAYRALW